MKGYKTEDLRKKSASELNQEAAALIKQRLQAMLDRRAGKLANTTLPKRLSDVIARVKTIITEKNVAAAQSAVAKIK